MLEAYSGQHKKSAVEQSTVSVMTDVTMESISRLELECATSLEENIKLQSDLQSLKQEDTPTKVCYYIRSPSIEILNAVFEFVSTHVLNTRSATPPFQQYVLVLMKLRLNVDSELFSTLFHIHACTVSRYLRK